MLDLSQYLTTNNIIESQGKRQRGTGALKDKDQRHRAQDSEINLHSYSHLIPTKYN